MSSRGYPIVASGDDALRILCGPGHIRYQIARHLSGLNHWVDIVPGKEDVTIVFDLHSSSMRDAAALLQDYLGTLPEAEGYQGILHELPAAFGIDHGPDLSRLAVEIGLSEQALIEAVVQAEFEVDLIGFTPGFAYLTGLPNVISAGRLPVPRVRVPAGSIGVLTGQAGLYALDGPGGWPLIGRVLVQLFDPLADKPFRLVAGDRVRFVPVSGA
jgi:allophanate hydrolase